VSADNVRVSLEAFVRELVADEVARQLEHRDGTNGDTSPWRSRNEAAVYLGVSVRTLDRERERGRIRPKLIGSRPFYHRDDLDALDRGGERGASANPLHPAAARE
jgi:hypothetical protein